MMACPFKGYWINRYGSLTATYHVPSRWERVREWFKSRSWVAMHPSCEGDKSA